MRSANERLAAVGVFTLLVVSLTGCETEAEPRACIPGEQAQCACPGGGTGVQLCKPDGTGFGTCASCTSSTPAPDGGPTCDPAQCKACVARCQQTSTACDNGCGEKQESCNRDCNSRYPSDISLATACLSDCGSAHGRCILRCTDLALACFDVCEAEARCRTDCTP